MPKTKDRQDDQAPAPAEAATATVNRTEQSARALLQGRTGVTRGCPAAPLDLWISLAESVYPADHPVLKELRKQLTSG